MARPTVLILDDNELLRDVFRLAVEGEGYLAVTAANLEEAETILSGIRPDVVLTDLVGVSRGPNPWATVDRLRALAGGVPVVVCTADGRAAKDDAQERHVFAIVEKPFALEELLDTLERAAKSEHDLAA